MAAILTALLALTACGKQEVQPVVPDTPEPPGTLMGVTYETGGGMMAGSEFSIRLNRQEIEHTEFWPLDEYADEMTVRTHISITEQQWAEVETVLLELYRDGKMTEFAPKPAVELPKDLFVLDGGDYNNLSLVWETEDGTVETGYHWPNDRRVLTLIALLQELADPKGREIVWYETPELYRIYISRSHWMNTDRDYSFQLHWTEYDDEDAHWELIYYLGKHGAVDQGRIPLEDTDWEAFLELAAETQLEYFPEPTKSDDRFRCTLSYTDGTYQNIVLNEQTEERLQTFFRNMITKYEED